MSIVSSGDLIDNFDNIYNTLCKMIKSNENITLPNLIFLAGNMMVMLDIYKLSKEKKIELVIAVLLQYIGNQDLQDNEKTVLLEYVKNDLSNLIMNLIKYNQNETMIISEEPEKTPKKSGLVRVAVLLCSCLIRKRIKESEGVWV